MSSLLNTKPTLRKTLRVHCNLVVRLAVSEAPFGPVFGHFFRQMSTSRPMQDTKMLHILGNSDTPGDLMQ